MVFIYLCTNIIFLLSIVNFFLPTCSGKNNGKKKNKGGISRTPSVFAKIGNSKEKKPVIEVSSLREDKMESSSFSRSREFKKKSSKRSQRGPNNNNDLERKSPNLRMPSVKQKNSIIQNKSVHNYKTDKFNLQITQKQPVAVAVESPQNTPINEVGEKNKNVIDPVKTVGDFDEEASNDKNKQIEDPIKTIMNEPDLQKNPQVEDDIHTVMPEKLCDTQVIIVNPSPIKSPLKEVPKQVGSQKNDGKSEINSLMNDSKAFNDQYETLNNIDLALPVPIQEKHSKKEVVVEIPKNNDKVDGEKIDDKKKIDEKKEVSTDKKKDDKKSNEIVKCETKKNEKTKVDEKKSPIQKDESKDKKSVNNEKKKKPSN